VMQEITGLDTLVLRYQGEFAYNLGVKGFKWDTANGGVNPVNSAINDGTNWDPALTDVRERAGVVMTTL
jgi:Major capsid protein 13-like